MGLVVNRKVSAIKGSPSVMPAPREMGKGSHPNLVVKNKRESMIGWLLSDRASLLYMTSLPIN